jgi:hypothetical protein
MMNRNFVIVVLVLAAGGMAIGAKSFASQSSLSKQLVGSWRLQSRQTRTADGALLMDAGLAQTPSGVLIYDSAGHVAAQLSRQGRTVEMLASDCREAVNIKGTDDTAQTVLGYDAYFGTYTIDEAAGIVTHHLEAALFPGDIGKSIKRAFEISGDTLTIRFDTTTGKGVAVTRTLVWTRIK